MAFAVVLDTCVLYPAHLRDTLLRLAERGFYRPLWSRDILDELQRNLIERGIEEQSVTRLVDHMTGAFQDAMVTGYEPLAEVMTCDEKDRHVLAAAVRADAASIITFNLADFPEDSLKPYSLDAIHPDEFLLDTYDLAPDLVFDEIGRQAAANTKTPKTVLEISDALTLAGASQFGDLIRTRHLQDELAKRSTPLTELPF